jgi:hypothetical protein
MDQCLCSFGVQGVSWDSSGIFSDNLEFAGKQPDHIDASEGAELRGLLNPDIRLFSRKYLAD